MGAGLIRGAPSSPAQAEAAEPVDLGLTIMRAGFSSVIPHGQSTWRWFGTLNSVELDTSWTQPASFGVWLPGRLMEMVVAVVLLRSISPGTPGDVVTIASFAPAEAYMFGNSPGMARFTPTTFIGQFALPNDLRLVLR